MRASKREGDQRYYLVERLGNWVSHWDREPVERGLGWWGKGNGFTFSEKWFKLLTKYVHLFNMNVESTFFEVQDYIASLWSEKAPALCVAPPLGPFSHLHDVPKPAWPVA